MKQTPMPFQTDMVQAVLDLRKTQTRRARGLKRFNADPDFWSRKGNPSKAIHTLWDATVEPNPNPIVVLCGFKDPLGNIEYVKCPYGKVGDLLWVKETFQQRSEPAQAKGFDKFYYKAGWEGCTDGGWKPSLFMPKEAARIWLKITDIKVERLQDISEDDAKAEGVELIEHIGNCPMYKHYLTPKNGYALDVIHSFETLFRSINGPDSWNLNPWVWVISFQITNNPNQ